MVVARPVAAPAGYFPTSNLASITSDGEDQWIRAQMSEATTLPEKRAYWIGLIKDGSRALFTHATHWCFRVSRLFVFSFDKKDLYQCTENRQTQCEREKLL